MKKWHGAIVCAAVMLCSCQPRGNAAAAGRGVAGRPGRAGGGKGEPAAAVWEGVASNASGAAAAALTPASGAAAQQYAPRAAAVPVRIGKLDERLGHTALSVAARDRGLDAKEAVELIKARSEKLREQYGGQDTSPRGKMAERGVVMKEAMPGWPEEAEAGSAAP